ncbi:hypothetical protein A3K24_02200 [candidate division Kazan bacterium RIFCSPHIGHO2_01_FULL_44_14]|uniref:ABC transporter substrate-binding protein n=1 Tax=candidate division Kazan bacterium RIFCSPLOWO2_01_FULL_45_19 TaxID=1798538 RepID=A0A1F4NQ98_UNCK3|nr:hypothetical protein [uncultured bacterium]AQS31054.1 hypothetical protein [uncultured bacterium]OGB73633.1 MAG: hypothetical protein A3K51_02200 [candidate division Kazan bacterium RIFCSPLOWO2_01_FULL_45_19]OGB77878.1 MAG: hypothetical protein A3K24_02200 [candidate division Kazan bacterium RIFCSPHIGHO2_01_FULL_44_14]
MTNRHRLYSIFLALLIGVSLTALSCKRGGSSDTTEAPPVISNEPITLEYWRLWDESDALDELINSYTSKHPNITIEVKKISLKPGETIYDYQQNLIKLIADGAGPDMFMLHNDWLPYQINQIAPMPAGLMSVKDYRNLFPDVVQTDFISNNRIYAVPYYIDDLMLFYNTDIFSAKKIKQPPRTLQDLVDLIPKLTEKDSRGNITRSAITLGGNDGIPRAADILAALMMQYGAEMTSADHTTATFNLPAPDTNPPFMASQNALSYYTQFATPGSPVYTYTDAKNADGSRVFPSDVQAFIEGKAAMMFGYAYHVPLIQQFAPKLRFETAVLPQRQIQNPITIANYWGETVSKNSQHPNEAWDFIKFMTKRNSQSAFFRATGHIPASKELQDTMTSRRYYAPVAQQIDYAKSWYRKNTPEIESIFGRMIDSVVKDKISPEVAIDVAVRDINKLE